MATKLPQRIFALSFAILFFVSASAFAGFVIYDAVKSKGDQPVNTSTQDNALSCQEDKTEAPLQTPEIYKTAEKVSELQKIDLTVGTGAVAKSGDCVIVQYYGTLAKDGKLFDQNYTTSSGFAFMLGQNQVIQGWEQGVTGMKEGGVRRLVVPSALAYGNASPSEAIPANSDLVFVVKLLRIKS